MLEARVACGMGAGMIRGRAGLGVLHQEVSKMAMLLCNPPTWKGWDARAQGEATVMLLWTCEVKAGCRASHTRLHDAQAGGKMR